MSISGSKLVYRRHLLAIYDKISSNILQIAAKNNARVPRAASKDNDFRVVEHASKNESLNYKRESQITRVKLGAQQFYNVYHF